MGRRLPPLASLRVFEAVARHLSFTKAAEELHVTQAAVSHQVKNLEAWLGIRLFLRMNRTIRLTKAGEAYATPLTKAYDLIADATNAVLSDVSPESINISTFDSIAAGWLARRIRKFQASDPSIAIKVRTQNRFTDFVDGDVEVEIRYGDGDWPNLHVTKIADEHIFAVCSPKLLGRRRKLKSPHELDSFDLIHDELVMEWEDWLRAAGAEPNNAHSGLRFNHSHIVTQAAINGEGVALGRSLLVADDLNAKRLIRPLDFEVPSAFAYYLVCPKQLAEQDAIKAFRLWLTEEAQATMEYYLKDAAA
ncbi:MAG: transcriptional regulator GcvA [Pseudomonadota bacterium]